MRILMIAPIATLALVATPAGALQGSKNYTEAVNCAAVEVVMNALMDTIDEKETAAKMFDGASRWLDRARGFESNADKVSADLNSEAERLTGELMPNGTDGDLVTDPIFAELAVCAGKEQDLFGQTVLD